MSHPWHKVLVVDTESTCWETKELQGQQPSEIIEIGFCTWDSREGINCVSDPISYFVRPECSSVSDYCTSLTGIRRRTAIRGMDFISACALLEEHHGSKSKVWAGFGDDAAGFRKQCERYRVDYPFGERYLDVSALFSLIRGKRLGLVECLKEEGLEFIGREHSAKDDAYNTARLLRKLLKGKSP